AAHTTAAAATPSVGAIAAPAVAVPVAIAAAAAPSPAEAASATPRLLAAAPAASTPAAKPASSAATKPARKRSTGAPSASAAPSNGVVRLAVSPWGQVEIDGTPAGLTPPLSQLSLSEGRHQIIIRNADFPAFSTTITVAADQPVVLRHRFGP
ncbi:MAG: PEGA domain-containing protein, partial [Betaproteobacteria bacterium]